MKRLLRRALGLLLILIAVALVGGKAWIESGRPYLEALEPYPYCSEARTAMAGEDYLHAIELAEAGGCPAELTAANEPWNELGAIFQRCVDGVWTGRGDDTASLVCAVASDLVVFGDVRDLTRQGAAWLSGGETDPLLIGLSAAGLVLTFAPQLGAGTSLFKGARRAGAVSEPLAKSVVKHVQDGAWRPLSGLLTDAGRISTKVGPARGARALAYADDADDLAAVARFVDAAPNPLLGLRWGGRGAARLTNGALYAEALKRGPAGVQLALSRGTKALLKEHPLIVFVSKTFYKNGAAIATLFLRHATWPYVLWAALISAVAGAILARPRRKRRARYRGA